MYRWLSAVMVCLPKHLTESAPTQKGTLTDPYSRLMFSTFWYVGTNTEVLVHVLETS
jgi:hypothetical protein